MFYNGGISTSSYAQSMRSPEGPVCLRAAAIAGEPPLVFASLESFI